MKCSIHFDLSAITVGAADLLKADDWTSSSMFSISSRLLMTILLELFRTSHPVISHITHHNSI